jgi:hypothetical protein
MPYGGTKRRHKIAHGFSRRKLSIAEVYTIRPPLPVCDLPEARREKPNLRGGGRLEKSSHKVVFTDMVFLRGSREALRHTEQLKSCRLVWSRASSMEIHCYLKAFLQEAVILQIWFFTSGLGKVTNR